MISSTQGFIAQSEKYSRFMAGKSLDKYVELHEGEFSYNRGNSKTFPQGCVFRLDGWEAAAVPNVYISFRLTDSGINPKFLEYFFSSGGHNNQLARVITSGARGNGLLNISSEDFFSLRIPLPPRDEQSRIAEILQCADAAVDAADRVVEQAERVKRGVVEQLLTRGMPGQHKRLVATEIGELPAGWSVMRLEDLASVNRGKFSHRPRNEPRLYGGATAFVQTGDVAAAHGWYLEEHEQTLSDEGLSCSRLFPAGTLLVTIAANIGRVALTRYPVACPDSLVAVQPKHPPDTDWLLAELQRRQPELERNAPQNAQKNINLEVLRPLRVAVPPPSERQLIGERYREIHTSVDLAVKAAVQARTVRKGLLQTLLSGSVRGA
jgi:type I restriction enzyme S subunit